MPQNYTSTNIGLGAVTRRTPIKENVEAYIDAFNRLDASHDAALQQRNAILAAVSNIKLNAAEDNWKTNYINNIVQKISNASKYGSYASAETAATLLAGNVAIDPALRGRERANVEYEKYKAQVENNNQLDRVTKDRWLAQNPYSYEDKYDKNGNIVGGSNWTPNWNPVNRFDMTKLYELTKKLAAVEAGGGESAQFLDENGNLTSDPSKGFYGMAVKRGSKWERLDEDKLKKVFNSLFEQAPEARDYLLQEMDDRRWQYDNDTDKDKKSFIGTDIMKEDGTMRTPSEYLAYRVNPVLEEMAYNHVWNSISFGEAYSQRQKDLKDAAARQQIAALDDYGSSVFSVPIELDYKDRAATSYATIQDAMTTVNNLWQKSMRTNEAKEFIRKRDYKGLADFLETKMSNKLEDNLRRRALSALKLLRDESDTYRTLVDGMTKDEREAAEFLFAKESGAKLPNAENNKFTLEYSKKLNDLFSYVKNPGFDGSRTAIDNIFISFQDNDQKNKLLNKLGLDERTLKNHGLSIKTINGKEAIVVNKNSDYITELSDAFSSIGNKFWSWNSATLGKLDDNGNPIDDKQLGTSKNAIYALKQFKSDNSIFTKANSLVDNAFRAKGITATQTMQAKPFDDYNSLLTNDLYIQGYITREQKNDFIKRYSEDNMQKAGLAFNDLANYAVYGRRDENGNLVKLTPEEKQEAQEHLLAAYSAGQIELSPSDSPHGYGYGTIINVKQKAKTGEQKEIQGGVYYIDGLLANKAAEAIASDPDARARHKYQSDRGIGNLKNDVVGNKLSSNEEIAIQQYKMLDLKDALISDILHTGKRLEENDAKKAATELLIKSGYNPNSSNFASALGKLMIDLQKY